VLKALELFRAAWEGRGEGRRVTVSFVGKRDIWTDVAAVWGTTSGI